MAAVARLTQTITVLDKSNQVVGASKQLKNVFHEAKNAYLERKADIKAQRKQKEERELRKAIEHMSMADQEETRSEPGRSRPQRRRRNSDEFSHYSHAETNRSARYSNHRARYEEVPDEAFSPRSRSSTVQINDSVSQAHSTPGSPAEGVPRGQLIRRSKTDIDTAPKPQLTRSHTTPDVDLDLAYGDFHDEDLKQLSRAAPRDLALREVQQKELGTLIQKCQGLLDEADCAQHSVRKMVAHLQGNPDAMAAVALTLAEISNIASKMAPGALAMFKTSAPAVMALLASPQFLIAVGVGIGVTVVMFGGYKIVKKIKEHKANSAAASQDNLAYGSVPMDEALDVSELDRIEMWRRGIADVHLEGSEDTRTEVSGYSATSYTTVEGEIITPFAASMGHLPLKKSKSRSKKDKKDKKDKEKKDKKASKKRGSVDDASVEGEQSSRAASITAPGDRQLIKVKKPSPLRRMFVSGTSVKS